jgi:chemotaxis response regulator CheB
MAKMVLVVDDSRWIRERLRNVFDSAEGFEVCGEAGNGREGVEKAEQLHPDLIILDLSMPVMNGIDAARILHRILPSVPVILFSYFRRKRLSQWAFRHWFRSTRPWPNSLERRGACSRRTPNDL